MKMAARGRILVLLLIILPLLASAQYQTMAKKGGVGKKKNQNKGPTAPAQKKPQPQPKPNPIGQAQINPNPMGQGQVDKNAKAQNKQNPQAEAPQKGKKGKGKGQGQGQGKDPNKAGQNAGQNAAGNNLINQIPEKIMQPGFKGNIMLPGMGLEVGLDAGLAKAQAGQRAEAGLPNPDQVKVGVLKEGFYAESCPQAEKIVYDTLQKAFQEEPTMAAALIRLFFHDCWVQGCDASILLDETPEGKSVEKNAPHNGPFVRGYDVIEKIKANLEKQCPGVVSCADIMAFANRDALVFTGVPSYKVAAGRRDGRTSLAALVPSNLPLPETPINDIIKMFTKKNFTIEDMVVLIGAHSVGKSHCSIVRGRFMDEKKSKEIDPGYLILMRMIAFCLVETQDIPFDPLSHDKIDSHYYKFLLERKALLESDHEIAKEPRSRAVMEQLVNDNNGFLRKFTQVVTKMGQVGVLTGNQGEIRAQCKAYNK